MSLRHGSIVALLAAALAAPAAAFQTQPSMPNGIAAGDVTATSVVLWARSTSVGGSVAFHLVAHGQTVGQVLALPVTDALLPVKTRFEGLAPATPYIYQVTDLTTGEMLSGRFRTPALAGARQPLRFGVSGDWRGELRPYSALKNAADTNLDFFVELGDTIYADDDSPILGNKQQADTLQEFRLKHSEVYSAAEGLDTLADLRASTAIFSTIDDHEVTDDFAGGADVSTDPRFDDPPGTLINDAHLYEDGLQAFFDYNPMQVETYGETGDPLTANEYMLFRNRRFGDTAELIMLDCRSFRDQELPQVTNPTDPVQIATFLAASFDPSRSMLGNAQLRQLLRALKAAQADGVQWKFVCVQEPIENLGPAAASDRFEGYAAERDKILKTIQDDGIQNVVFITADIHGTVVNDLTRTDPATIATGQYLQIPVPAFEAVSSALAYDAPFGPTVAGLAFLAGLIDAATFQFLATPPVDLGTAALQSAGIGQIINGLFDVLPLLGGPAYSHLGLDDAPLVDARLESGSYVATNSFGWSEFEVDPVTGQLTVTTWGVPWYPETLVLANPAAVAALQPAVVSSFVVNPAP